MRFIIILAMSMCAVISAVEAEKLSPAAQTALQKAATAVAKNRESYDKANAKAFADADKALKAELDRLTKAGKLDEALALKEVMGTYQQEVVKKVDADANTPKDTLGKTLEDPIVGTWLREDRIVFTFNADGTGSARNMPLKWKKVNGAYRIDYITNPNWFMTVDKDITKGTTETGAVFTLVRQ